MIIRKSLYFLFIFFSFSTFGQTIPGAITQEINRRIELEINPSISIGVLLPSGEVQFYNYGSFDKNHQTADSLTLYEIGSVTKTFTSALANKYFENSLDISLSKIFTEINNENLEKISLTDLRNHISGLPRLSKQFSPEDWSDPFNGYSNEILIGELKKVEPDTSKSWNYSNFGYGILGRSIEIKTNKDFEDLMGKLLNDIGMHHTYLMHPPNPEIKIAEPTNIGTKNKFWNFTGPSRYAGGLLSCTSDLITYLKFQKENNPLFSTGTIENTIQTGIDFLGKDQLFYKNGWFVFKPDDVSEILLHNGGTGGFTSFLAYNKHTKKGVVMLSNSVSLVDDLGLKLLYPDFELKKPERTIAYELADHIEMGNSNDLVQRYNELKEEGYPNNILNIYWLERYNYGTKNWQVSNQLSDILVATLPDDWEAWDVKGQNLESLEDYKNAKKAYTKALKLNPDSELIPEKIKRCQEMLD